MERRLFLLISLTLLLSLDLASRAPWLQSVEERLMAPVWGLYASGEPERRVVVVDIDEKSLRRQGAWPWSRPVIARLIENTLASGASVVMVDMVFPERRDGDASLAKVLANRPVVMGQIFSSSDQALAFSNAGALSPYGSARVAGTGCPAGLIQAGSYLANDKSLGVRYAGHISPAVDADGTVRRIPALVCYRGRTYPALSLSGLALLSEAKNGWAVHSGSSDYQAAQVFTEERDFLQRWFAPAYWITHPQLPGVRLPVERDGLTRIPFSRARAAYAAVSASDVLAGKSIPFDGAIVLIGASAFGVSDSVPVPLSGLATGMEVHLQMLSGLLDRRMSYRPVHQIWIDTAFAILMTGALFLAWRGGQRLASGWRSLMPVLISPLLVVVVLAIELYWFFIHGLWTFHLALLLYPILLASILLVVRQWQLNRQRNRAIAHLHAFAGGGALSEHFQDSEGVAAHAEALSKYLKSRPEPQVEPITASVVFADLCGFTSLYSRYPEDTIARLIHQFYGSADWVVRSHGGAIDKYLGDGFMAVFTGQDHAQRSVLAAVDLLKLMSQRKDSDGLTSLSLKIGIDSGRVLTGVFGSGQRLTHTVFGSPVNQAARLEGLTRELDQMLLITELTYEGIDRPDLREQFGFWGRYNLGGAVESTGIFSLKSLDEDLLKRDS